MNNVNVCIFFIVRFKISVNYWVQLNHYFKICQILREQLYAKRVAVFSVVHVFWNAEDIWSTFEAWTNQNVCYGLKSEHIKLILKDKEGVLSPPSRCLFLAIKKWHVLKPLPKPEICRFCLKFKIWHFFFATENTMKLQWLEISSWSHLFSLYLTSNLHAMSQYPPFRKMHLLKKICESRGYENT